MTNRLRHVSVLATASLTAVAHAQTATLAISHNHPTGVVAPGATVQFTVTLSWTGAWQAARVAGDAVATPDIGTAFANGGTGSVSSGPLVNFGTPVAGSIRGADVGAGPNLFGFGIPGPWNISPLSMMRYSWTAPSTLGIVEFDFVPHPDVPNALFYVQPLSSVRTPLPTTYLGTSITVIPAPASAAALFLAGAVVSRRRRRP